MAKDDGGPAFPTLREDSGEGWRFMQDGASLRDYFAAAALTGLVTLTRQGDTAEKLAHEAYKVADSMLAARAQAGEDDG